ncbi:MAG: tetratricopeptide repeat protein [Gemmatimonadales bacterium]
MRTTASYDLFPDAPSERAMVRARWLAREGRVADAEAAYRDVLHAHPEFKPCWAEYFELLRRHGRPEEALRLADGARGQFGETAFPYTLRGAALIELDRFRDALQALEQALERDPDLALAWHELGYAAYRLGDKNRALLALDRAFALEPHTETLRLRGRILREAGRYQAAEVAFEGAAQAAEHVEQRQGAEREIVATRRYAFYAPRRPDDLSPGERWFADTGTVVLAPDAGPVAPSDEALMKALLELAHDRGWRFGQVVAAGGAAARPLWVELAAALHVPLVDRPAFALRAVPLVVAPRPLPDDAVWAACAPAVADGGAGLAFVLEHPAEATATDATDVIGVLTDGGVRRPRMPNPVQALSEAQHPAARFAGRRLHLD